MSLFASTYVDGKKCTLLSRLVHACAIAGDEPLGSRRSWHCSSSWSNSHSRLSSSSASNCSKLRPGRCFWVPVEEKTMTFSVCVTTWRRVIVARRHDVLFTSYTACYARLMVFCCYIVCMLAPHKRMLELGECHTMVHQYARKHVAYIHNPFPRLSQVTHHHAIAVTVKCYSAIPAVWSILLLLCHALWQYATKPSSSYSNPAKPVI